MMYPELAEEVGVSKCKCCGEHKMWLVMCPKCQTWVCEDCVDLDKELCYDCVREEEETDYVD